MTSGGFLLSFGNVRVLQKSHMFITCGIFRNVLSHGRKPCLPIWIGAGAFRATHPLGPRLLHHTGMGVSNLNMIQQALGVGVAVGTGG